jgi:hypothetical protein
MELLPQPNEPGRKLGLRFRLRDIEKAPIDSFSTGADGLKVAVTAPLCDALNFR